MSIVAVARFITPGKKHSKTCVCFITTKTRPIGNWRNKNDEKADYPVRRVLADAEHLGLLPYREQDSFRGVACGRRDLRCRPLALWEQDNIAGRLRVGRTGQVRSGLERPLRSVYGHRKGLLGLGQEMVEM